MHSLIQRDIHSASSTPSIGDDGSSKKLTVPELFTDPGYHLLGTSVLSTSNCGNPALRLFGFGPVIPEGYGIGMPCIQPPFHPPTHNPTPPPLT